MTATDPLATADAAWQPSKRESRRPNGAGTRQSHRRFHAVRFKDIRLSLNRPYLVKGLLPREGLVVVWGPPKCGKSFLVFDLMLHVALGWEYRGRRVQAGVVCYIACEGERGLGARKEAFRLGKLADEAGADPPFHLITTRLDLVADVDTLIGDIRAEIGTDGCAAIVIDTLNRSIAGSESRDEDMGAYVKAADRLREAFGAAVIVIHHCGHNGERPRGHTSLTGAADAQIAVKRDDAGRVIATVEYMKDGTEGDVIASRLVVVKVGADEDGEPITSCIIEPIEGDAPIAGRKAKRLPDAAKIALDTLRKAIAEAGSAPDASNHIPAAARVVDVETWRRFHYAGTASDGQTVDARRKAFQRVRQQLQAAGIIGFHVDLCWIVADV